MIPNQLKRPIPKPRTYKPVPTPRSYKPIPTPRKIVQQMIQDYEENIILPPIEFRDKSVPTPRKPVPTPRKPVPSPRTKINETNKALKGYAKSYEINIKNNKDPLIQLQNTRKALEYYITVQLNEMKGLKFVETLRLHLQKCQTKKECIRPHISTVKHEQ